MKTRRGNTKASFLCPWAITRNNTKSDDGGACVYKIGLIKSIVYLGKNPSQPKRQKRNPLLSLFPCII